jgi:hypothetical protein
MRRSRPACSRTTTRGRRADGAHGDWWQRRRLGGSGPAAERPGLAGERDEESKGLRKVAKGRVAAWLKGVVACRDLEPLGVDEIAPNPEPVSGVLVAAVRDEGKGESMTMYVQSRPRASSTIKSPVLWLHVVKSPPNRPGVLAREVVKDAPAPVADVLPADRERVVSVAPNPRSSGFEPLRTLNSRHSLFRSSSPSPRVSRNVAKKVVFKCRRFDPLSDCFFNLLYTTSRPVIVKYIDK